MSPTQTKKPKRTQANKKPIQKGFSGFLSKVKNYLLALTPEKKLFLFGILLCIIAISLSFDWGVTIRHGDSTFPEDPELTFNKAIQTWDDQRRLGIDSSRGVADAFPYKGLTYLLSLIGFPVFLIQILMFGGLFVLPFISMFYLTKVLFPKQKFGLMSFFSGLFYTFNIFVLIKFSIPVFVIQLAYALLPLLIAFGLQFLDTGKKRYFAFFILIMLLNSSIGNNIAFYVPLVIVFGVLFIHRLVSASESRWEYFKRIGLMVLGSLVISLWWFIPQITAISTQYSSLTDSEFVQEYNETALRSSSFEGHILNSFRLIGTWTWSHNDLYGNAFFEESQLYDGLLSFWGILLVVLTLMALLIKRSSYVYVVIFSLTFFLGLFFMKGISDPFGGVFMFMFENIPLFWIFRFTYDKFGPVTALSQSILIGYTLYWLAFKFIPRFKTKAHIVLTILTGLILFYMYPIWMGNTFRDGHPVKTQVNFPNAYHEANNYLNELPINQQRIALLPFSRGTGIAKAFQWSYVGMDPFEFLSRHSVIYHLLETDGPSADMVKLMKTLLHEGQWKEFVAIAPLFNVDKIVMENNADIGLFPNLYFSEDFANFAEANKDILLERSFDDEIDIYQLPNSEKYEKLYVPETIYHYKGDFARLSDLSALLNPNQREAFILDEYNEDIDISVGQFSNHIVAPVPGVYETDSLENISIESLENGEYNLWHRQNDYQLYEISIRPSGQIAELLFTQPERRFKVNGKEVVLPYKQETVPLQINMGQYNHFYLVVNDLFLGQIEADQLKTSGSLSFGQYPLQADTMLNVKIYAEESSHQGAQLVVKDPSFESGTWSEVRTVGESKGGEDIQVAQRVKESTDGDNSVEIKAQNRDAAIYQNIFGYDPSAFYRVAFDYQVQEGTSPYINLIEQGVDIYNTLNLKRGTEEEWQKYEHLIRPNNDATGLSLYLYAKAPDNPNEASRVRYDNIRIFKIPMIQELRLTFSNEEALNNESIASIGVSENTLAITGSGNLTDVTEKILKNASFEEGQWSKPSDSKADLPGIPNMISQVVPDAYEGENALLLSTDRHKANVHHRLENLDTNVRYIFSISTKKNSGSDPSFLIHQKGVNIYEPKDTFREDESLQGEWNTHRFSFNPHAQADGATLYLYAGDGKEEFSEVLYDAIKIYQVNSLDSFLVEKQTGSPFKSVDIDYTHHSPTYYSGTFSRSSDDFVMVFGESYHPNWKMKLIDKANGQTQTISEEDHFIINGYANAWKIPAGEWKFEIRFTSQKTYIRSILLSLVLSILFFGFYFKHSKKKKFTPHLRDLKQSKRNKH